MAPSLGRRPQRALDQKSGPVALSMWGMQGRETDDEERGFSVLRIYIQTLVRSDDSALFHMLVGALT